MKKLISMLLTLTMCMALTTPAFATTYSNANKKDDYYPDSDGDGLVDALELAYGSDPYNSDTDGDGVSDYIEFYVTHTDLFTPDGDIDSDGDGLTNVEEAIYGTHPADPDIDGDGLSDGDEVNIYKTDPLVADSDNDGLLDGVEVELGLNPLASSTDSMTEDAMTPLAQEYFTSLQPNIALASEEWTVDPLAAGDDTDYDGRIDATDTDPNSNLFRGTLYTEYATTSVTYYMDYRWFFSSNKTYNSKLAVVSSLLSSNIYADNHLNITTGGSLSTSNSSSMTSWMSFHGMTNIRQYTLTNSDNHLSEMYIGRREVTYGGSTKNIVCIVIRGTNGTIEEWSSNFDVGSTASSHSEWTDTKNHKGFDITTNRLNTYLNSYLTTYCSGKNNVLWITGHSRGGALANLLAAKQINAGKTVYAYTFAAPNTTTATSVDNAMYSCIFNIINDDDFVPCLPLTNWEFGRYGVPKSGSIAESYEVAWEYLTGISDYDSDADLKTTINTLATIANDRNLCYVYRTGADGYIENFQATAESRDAVRKQTIATYTSNTVGTYKYTNVLLTYSDKKYGFKIHHQPAFLMQSLAGVMGGEMPALNFALLDVAPYLEDAKWAVIRSNFAGIKHPHYTESYYLLACVLS